MITKNQPVRVNELIRSAKRYFLDLNGNWDFQLDPEDTGEKRKIYEKEGVLDDVITVPGCLEAQGKGLTYLSPARPGWAGTCDMPYLGTSWYKKKFRLSADLKDKLLWLNFGGIATDCKIWLNGELLGEHHYAAIPFGFNITNLVDFSTDNILTVMVENNHHYNARNPENTHGLGSTTMEMRWSGIYRAVEIVATEKTWLEDLYIISDIDQNIVRCQYKLGNKGESDFSDLQLTAEISEWNSDDGLCSMTSKVNEGGEGEIVVDITNPHYWSEKDPFLYKIRVSLTDSEENQIDSLGERFGFREISFDGEHILLNKKPIYLRGDMVHFHWPVTVSPPTDREDLRSKLGMYKKYGFNFLRHHTHFPGVEYLEVCDEIGLLCHNELGVVGGSWGIEPVHREIMWENLIRRDRNHPAVIIWCMGNERLASDEQNDKYREITYKLDKTRFLLSNSPGWFIKEDGTKRRAPYHHEFRKAGGSYVDTSLKDRYVGSLRPWRMLFAEEQTKEAGIDNYLPKIIENTQKLQARCRKLLLEQIRMDDDEISDIWNFQGIKYQGYQLCTFRDSGSFIWGVINDYFEPKIVSPEELKKYNDDTVLLWTLPWQERVFAAKERRAWVPITLQCSHYGEKQLTNGILKWEIRDTDNNLLYSQEKTGINLRNGSVKVIETEVFELAEQVKAQKMNLKAELHTENNVFENQWDFWVFPTDYINRSAISLNCVEIEPGLREVLNKLYTVKPESQSPEEGDLLISGSINDVLLSHLKNGGRALLVGRYNFPGEVTEWGAGRSEYPRGTIIADHPLLADFPHEGWCDIPFAGMISYAEKLNGNRNELGYAVGLRDWPAELEPIIMGCPSYKQENPQRLAHLFEVKVGRGKLMITTLDLGNPRSLNAATGYFLDRLIKYLDSNEFSPKTAVSPEFLKQYQDMTIELIAETSDTRQKMNSNQETNTK